MTKEMFIKEEFPKLNFFTRQILKVHGKNHPELKEVRALFEQMQEKIKTNQSVAPELTQLETVTNRFTPPEDACEGYKTTYDLLQQFYTLNQ